MTSFTTRHYRIGQQPVVAVYGADRSTPIQAWYPNTDTGRLERKDIYIQDIDASDCASIISARDFQKFCDAAGIENKLPETAIRRTLSLLAQFGASNGNAPRIPVQQNCTQFTFG